MTRKLVSLAFLFVLFAFPSLSASRTRLDEYALVLNTPPVATHLSSRQALQTVGARDRLQQILAAQNNLRNELSRRHIRVSGAVQVLVNAVFVLAPPSRAAELRSLPGVTRVQWLPPVHRALDRAIGLVDVPGAWAALPGGATNAGAGVKIGILDTGIDQNHPAFQDASLSVPTGYPKGPDQSYTNNKVIVARSYVAELANITGRPDDTTPRDRVGHGTAVAMIAAGEQNSGPAATITGVAPKAWLGNYKIFGSPGVNDTTRGSIIQTALQDAYTDGMDIVVLSVGDPAVYGPLDNDPTCGGNGDCDIRAQAVEAATKDGMTVVVSAGNDGDSGSQFPALNTINSPGSAPSAITVGATTNSHVFFSSVSVAGLPGIDALFGDGPKPTGTLTAPLRDVSKLQDDGHACSALTNGSLTGAIALIQRGNCDFSTKVNYAQKAGAVGVIIYQVDGQNYPFSPLGLGNTGIPAVMIGYPDGVTLKNYLQSNADAPVTLDPSLHATDASYDTVADFSSRGPNIGDFNIKPEVAAVGTDIYTATQTYDPNSDMYDPSGYTAVIGTSFSTPLVAGAAALVKQVHPNDYTPAQIKSAIVNTATTNSITDGSASPASVTAVGGGKLDAGAAVKATATAVPATLSFGVIGPGSLPASLSFDLTNTGNATTTYMLAVQPRNQGQPDTIVLSLTSVTLEPGQIQSVKLQLQGDAPPPGSFEGYVTVTGGGTTLHLPYLYMATDGIACNIFPVIGSSFTGATGDGIVYPDFYWLVAFKLTDCNGVPVVNQPVQFQAPPGGSQILTADGITDRLGIASAQVGLGSSPGPQVFTATAGNLNVEFDGYARLLPTINVNGVINAASGQIGQGLAPGSYISIFGNALSDASKALSTPYLPLSLAGVSVSFSNGAGLSLPGHLSYVSDGQINVQIPWEFLGQTSVQMTVSIGDLSSAVYNVPLNDYSPAAFEYTDAASGRQLVAAQDQNYQLITMAHPAQRGQPLFIYANGLGPVTQTLGSGEPSPSEPLAETTKLPTVTIGGIPADVKFSGLTPNYVGLYQINVIVPPDAPAGIQPVVITAGGVTSKTASVPVQ